MHTGARVGLLAALLLTANVAAVATAGDAPAFDVPAHYEKSEHRIAMRDGVHLHTVVYRPRDRSQKYPILLGRSPYSVKPYGAAYMDTAALAPAVEFLESGYILVFQDVRGAFNSEGEFVYLRPPRTNRRGVDEATDTWDTIEWLLKNLDGNNGRVGQWGISYDGWQTVATLTDPHPALKAVSPQASTADAFIGDDNHFNGVFFLAGSLGWAAAMSIATGPARAQLNGEWPDGGGPNYSWAYEFFLRAGPAAGLNQRYYEGKLSHIWEDLIAHPDYDDYWHRRAIANQLGRVKIPVLNVAGWFDHANPYGTFATWRAIEQKNPSNRSTMVAGPWNHGGWLWEDGSKLPPHEFGAPTSRWFQRKVIFPFFERHLKQRGEFEPAEAVVFETGANQWHRYDSWPPRGVENRALYLLADGAAGFDAPSSTGADSIETDPARPVPYTSASPMQGGHDFLVEDQRLFTTRPDVLLWRSAPLAADLTIAGVVMARLFVSSSGTDGDWFVKLIDEYPDAATTQTSGLPPGYQAMVAFNVMRARYRDSFARPRPLVPGEVTPLEFALPDRFHTFRRGHRIVVQVQGSMFPLFDRNPQAFVDTYRAAAQDYREAEQHVHRGPHAASALWLPVLPPGRFSVVSQTD